MIDCRATQRVYLDHVAPIWQALPDEIRGTLFAGREVEHARRLGLDPSPQRGGADVVLVASSADLHRDGRPAIMVNHGAGQTYRGDGETSGAAVSSSYTGGGRREQVIANLCPGPADFRGCVTAQPDVPAFQIGVPKLDRHAPYRRGIHVAFAWHWHMPLVPEGTPAWGHYCDTLPDIAERWPTLGHGHPRMWRYYSRQYERYGIEPVRHWPDLLDRGVGLLVADNTSVMYEAAWLGIPVLALNAPWYRRDVHHSLRFWSHVPGFECDQPEDLAESIEAAFDDPPQARALRAHAARYVYGSTMTDGNSTARAVDAIIRVLDARR